MKHVSIAMADGGLMKAVREPLEFFTEIRDLIKFAEAKYESNT